MALDYYVALNYWVDGYTVNVSTSTTAQGPTTVQTTIPAYLYWEYNDDQNLLSFVSAYNVMTQQVVNTLNQLNLPIYTGPMIVGPLLDWAATGIYGQRRPVLSSGTFKAIGPYNTTPWNTLAYDTYKKVGNLTQTVTTDDIFKRIMTWNLYRGDGNIFNVLWLKRRVARFLTGLNGTDPGIDQTYLVSVVLGAANSITIDLTPFVGANPSSNMPSVLQAAMQSNVLNVPFQYYFSVIFSSRVPQMSAFATETVIARATIS